MRAPIAQRFMFAANVVMFVTLVVTFATGSARQAPREVSVERLNIVDSTGAPVLVLANGARLPGNRFGGREYPQSFTGRGRSAGMLFYNSAGDEVGGLIYQGDGQDSSYQAFGHLSFDQWKQNQVVAVQYTDNGRSRAAGVRVWDRPADQPLEQQFALAQQMLAAPPGAVRDSLNRERLGARERVAGAQRLFLGSRDREAQLELRDPQGRVRIRISVDSAGAGRLVFLDSLGNETASYR